MSSRRDSQWSRRNRPGLLRIRSIANLQPSITEVRLTPSILFQVSDIDLGDGHIGNDAGIVDEHVEAPESLPDHVRDLCAIQIPG